MVDIEINKEIVHDAINYFASNNLEIEFLEDTNLYHVFDNSTSAQYTSEELVLQYLRETKRRYNNKVYW